MLMEYGDVIISKSDGFTEINFINFRLTTNLSLAIRSSNESIAHSVRPVLDSVSAC